MVRFQELCDQVKRNGHHRRPLLLVNKPSNSLMTSDEVRSCDLVRSCDCVDITQVVQILIKPGMRK